MGTSEQGVEVFVFKGGRFLGSRCYSQRTIVVGRGDSATLKLRDPSVSERHAIVRVEGTNVVVADNHSQSGVYVNGTRVNTRAVSSFDEISIGAFRIKLSLLGGAAEQDPGFGDESPDYTDEEQATQLHRVDDEAGAQALGGSGIIEEYSEPQATMPRIRQPDAPRERIETRPERGRRPRSRGYEAREAADPSDGFDDFAAPASAARGGRRATRREEPSYDARYEESAPAAPLGPPPDVDDAWDDEDEDDFVEPFSLLENVVRERFKSRTQTEPYAIAEVIRYNDGELHDLLRANPGQSIRIGPEDFRLLNVHESGRAQLFFKRGFSGTIVSGGKPRPIKRLCSEKYLVHRKQQVYGVELSEGDYAQIVRPEGGYLVRFVRPPVPPRPPSLRVGINWSMIQIFAGSAAFHFLLLVMLGFVAPEADLRVVTDAERFAKISIKDLKLEKPKEEPKEEPKPEEPPPSDEPKPKPKREKVKRKLPRAPPREVTAKQKQEIQKKQVKNVLSALQNLKPSGAPGRSDLTKLASNIAATRTPAGTASGFQISGAIRKIPGGGVKLAGGLGGGGADTKVGSQLLRGGLGKLNAKAGTGTRVRGRVRRAPTRAISASGGHLSREAIQKVVSQHMHQVQACYERQLITSPGLAGKIVFDWVITPSGSVGMARQVSSSMSSPAVSTCILGLIRTWRFPQPVGGSVQVRYPFVFRVSGF